MFVKLFALIKSMSLAAKITTIIVTVVVVGGSAATVIVLNQPKNEENTVSYQDNDNSQHDSSDPEPENSETDESLEPTVEDEKDNEDKPAAQPTEQPTQPSQPAQPAQPPQPEQPSQPSTPSQPEQPSQPEAPKTCSDLKNCDFNLNERFVIEVIRYNFYTTPEGLSSICDLDESGDFYFHKLTPNETKSFYQIGHFTGTGGNGGIHVTPTRTRSANDQALQYAKSHNYEVEGGGISCGGMGDIVREWTWQEVIDAGYALDEAKCATWGLSCGRW